MTDWTRQILLWLGRYAQPLKRPIYVAGDGSYATYELMIQAQNLNIGLAARMKMNAHLFHFPGPPPNSKRGRKPQVGKRLLSMDKRLNDKRIKWQQVVFSEWYASKKKTMLITTGVAIWDSNKGVRVPLRWVLIKDPDGQLEPVLLGCADLEASAVKVVTCFVRRWRVEVTFAEVRRHLGVETQRQWSDKSIERTTPNLMAIKSIICLMAKVLWDQG
jgi:hypothetical protein